MIPPIPSRAATTIWFLIFIMALVLVGRTLILIYEMVRPMPYWDAWEFMKALPSILDGRYTLYDLFAFHNEHRVVTTRLLMLADVHFFAASGYLSTAVLTVLLCCIGCLLAFVAVGRNWLGAVAATLTTSLLLSVAQWENYASGFQVAFPLVDLSAIISIGLFVMSCAPGRSLVWVGGAVVANAIAVGSMASGNIVVGPVILVALALRAPTLRVVAFVMPTLAMTAVYLVGYPKSASPPLYDVVGIVHFAVNYLGSTLRGIPGASLWLGAGLLIAYAVFLAVIAHGRWRREPIDFVLIWLAGIAAFTVMGALVTAAGRLSLGIETSTSSRYAIQSLLFASCIFLMGWRIAGAFPGRGRAQLGLTAACLALSAASTLAAGPGLEWRERVAAYDAAGEAFANGVFSDSFVSGVYPYPKMIQQALAFMAHHRLGPFSGHYADLYRPPTNAIAGMDINAMPACASAQDTVQDVGHNWQELVGWAFSRDRPAENGWVLAFNSEQRLLGYARQTIQRSDVSNAFHVAVSRVGYQIGLNSNDEVSHASKAATLVVVPESIDSPVCRASIEERTR